MMNASYVKYTLFERFGMGRLSFNFKADRAKARSLFKAHKITGHELSAKYMLVYIEWTERR